MNSSKVWLAKFPEILRKCLNFTEILMLQNRKKLYSEKNYVIMLYTYRGMMI